jgi:hypothetical protein
MTRAALFRVLALALPLAGLGWTWVSADRLSHQGTDWEVPVQGYDPRDLLRGHYVQFNYEWPGLDHAENEYAPLLALCLEGNPPEVTRVRVVDPYDTACPNLARAAGDGVYGYSELETGRLYASQAEAARLQEELWDRAKQGVIQFRLRPDGHITPQRFTFRPRPPGERRAGEADDKADADARAAVEVVPPPVVKGER